MKIVLKVRGWNFTATPVSVGTSRSSLEMVLALFRQP